jgi:dihydrofolate synthase/folylpolyglutamate synthase
MTAQEAIDYIHAQHWQNSTPGLARIRALLELLGAPQRGQKYIHVAGTDGKGSTCACIAAVLQAAGYQVGLNISPYLERFNERIQVNREEISDDALAELMTEIRPLAERMTDRPTEFELITAAALLHFRRQRCDISVLEVGLGGEKDASNVIDVPEVAVITAMGFDHVRELGPTMTDIAAAKAGIIKAGGAVVSYGGVPEADAVIHRVCRERSAVLREADFSRLRVLNASLEGSAFDFIPYHNLRLPLAGVYQPRNAAVALTALEVLREKGWSIPENAVRQGLAAVRWSGRFELLRRAPVFVLDGAHNPHGITAAAESLRQCRPEGKWVFLIGVMADKNVPEMLSQLAPLACAFVAVQPDNPRAMPAEALCSLLKPCGLPVQACTSVEDAVHTAVTTAGTDGAVCALGTLYFSGAVRQAVAELSK